MKTTLFKIGLIALTFCVFSSACSDDDKATETQNPSVAEFPIPYPDGEEIVTDNRKGATGQLTLFYITARHQEVIGFYENYTSGGGWNRSESGQGPMPSVIFVNLSKGLVISIGPPEGQMSDGFLVTLTAG